MNPVFSPTQTMAWDTCPMARRLRYSDKWYPRRIGKAGLSGLLGTAFAAGVAIHNYMRQSEQLVGHTIPNHTEACAQRAAEVAQQGLDAITQSGHFIGDYDLAQSESLVGRATKAVTKYIEQDPIPPEWRVVHIEHPLPEHGNARIDLGIEDHIGPAVLDFKTKLTLKAEYRQKEIARYKDSWQMRHYCWAYGEHVGQPIFRYYIALAVLEPRFSVELIPFVLDPEELATWLASARRAWADMAAEDRGERHVRMATTHETNFGPCEYRDACLMYRLDPSLMERDYARKESRK